MAPISRLPGELLAFIFILLPEKLFYDAKPKTSWTRVAILQVCKLWRNLALETPGFWCYINLSWNLKKIMTSLELSRTSPLTIRHEGYFEYSSVSEAHKLVLQHLPRIYDLELTDITLHCEKWEKIHGTIDLRRKAPLLQKLCLKVDKNSYTFRKIIHDNYWDCSKIIDGAFSLKFLSTYGVFFNWTTCTLRDLSVLKLNTILSDSKRPTVAQILEILALSPRLLLLELDRIGPLDSPVDSAVTVTLPLMKHFSLRGVQADVCAKMLDFIILPKNVRWNIQCLDYPISDPIIIHPKFATPEELHISISFVLEKARIEIQREYPDRLNFWTISDDFDGFRPSSHKEGIDIEWRQLQSPSTNFHKSVAALNLFLQSGWEDANNFKFVYREDKATYSLGEHAWITLLGAFAHIETLKAVFDHPRNSAETETNLAKALRHVSAVDSLIFLDISLYFEIHFFKHTNYKFIQIK